jgi:hypothetical protein
LSVNVSARICSGARRFVAMSQAMRRVIDLRLAGARAGHDQQRTLAVRDRLALLGMQAARGRAPRAEAAGAGPVRSASPCTAR